MNTEYALNKAVLQPALVVAMIVHPLHRQLGMTARCLSCIQRSTFLNLRRYRMLYFFKFKFCHHHEFLGSNRVGSGRVGSQYHSCADVFLCVGQSSTTCAVCTHFWPESVHRRLPSSRHSRRLTWWKPPTQTTTVTNWTTPLSVRPVSHLSASLLPQNGVPSIKLLTFYLWWCWCLEFWLS